MIQIGSKVRTKLGSHNLYEGIIGLVGVVHGCDTKMFTVRLSGESHPTRFYPDELEEILDVVESTPNKDGFARCSRPKCGAQTTNADAVCCECKSVSSTTVKCSRCGQDNNQYRIACFACWKYL